MPEITHVQHTLGTGGKTFIGDCKSQHLDKRLEHAHAEIARFNQRKQGKKRLSESALVGAAENIVTRQRVTGLVRVAVETVQTETPVRRYGVREARVKQECHSVLKTQGDEAAVTAAKARMGWHV